jgi:hypothetical protein
MVVDHNLVYNADSALKMNPPTNSNNLIYNNTLVGNVWGLSAGSHANMTNSVFANNIFVGGMIWGAGAIRSNNLNTTTANVGFVSASTGNYALASNSAAINAGKIIAPYTNGFTGIAPDLGAFEFGVTPWVAGVPIVTRNAKATIEAESFDSASGIKLQSPGIGSCDNGDWVKYAAVDFGAGATKMSASVAVPTQYAGGHIEIRLDSISGPVIGTLTVASTGSWSAFLTQAVNLTLTSGVHDLYLVFKGGFGVCNMDWLQFS